MALDFSPLANAVARLGQALARHHATPEDDQLRDGLIQRFEFTYDLAHKMLRRALEARAAVPEEIERMSFPTLIRTGWEQGLLRGDWPHWHRYREMRNITSHTYDEAKAIEVAQGIPAFLEEVQIMLARIAAREGT